MTGWDNMLTSATMHRVGWALMHFLWQGAAAAVLVAAAMWVLRRRSPNLRYVVACAGMLLMLAAPAVTICLLDPPAGEATTHEAPLVSGAAEEIAPAPARPAFGEPSWPATDGAEETRLVSGEAPALSLAPAQFPPDTTEQVAPIRPASEASPAPAASVEPAQPWRERAAELLTPLLPWVVCAWLLGVLALSLWHLRGWVLVQRLRRVGVQPAAQTVRRVLPAFAARLGVKRAVRALESAWVRVPTVIGWLRPVILLPTQAVTGLTAEQLEAILAHELAHIRRHDYLVNLLQAFAETLLFYHPGVWWVSRRIRAERENCCDDLAVRTCAAPVVYARALAAVAKLSMPQPRLAVAADGGGTLLARVRRIVGLPAEGGTRRSAWLAGALTLLAVLVIFVAGIAIPLACMEASGPQADGTDGPAAETPTTAEASQPDQSVLAICIVPNAAAQANRSAMISPDDIAKMSKQLAAEGPRPPQKPEQYWWVVLDGAQGPPPQAVLGEYRSQPCVLLCADWPKALAPWENAAFRYGIVSAVVVDGPEGSKAVQLVFEEEGKRRLSFMTRAYKGLAVALAVDGKVLSIETIAEPLKDTVVVAGRFTEAQAQALARRLLLGMAAVRAMQMAIQSEKIEQVRDLLDANPALVDAARNWPRGGALPLHSAAAHRNLEIARLLLERGAKVNAARSRDGQTPLHLAATNGREKMVRLLLDHGADISATSKEGFTPLHAAATHKRVSVATMLLDAGANVNATGKAGVTPLGLIALIRLYAPSSRLEEFAPVVALLRKRGGKVGIIGAAAEGDTATIKSILKADPRALKAAAVGSITPLHVAAMGGHRPVAELLLDAGAPVNPPGIVSPLTLAAGMGHIEVVKLLVQRGADVNAIDADRGTPIATAAHGGHKEIVSFLTARGAKLSGKKGVDALISAAKGAQVDTVRMLLDKGVDVNARSRDDKTALIQVARASSMEPAKSGVVETARLLLERGADVNARDNQNHTALTLACRAPFSRRVINADLVKLLIKHGAKVNLGPPARSTPLHNAAKKDTVAVVKLLLDAGADVFAEEMHGRTALEVAEQGKAEQAAEVLREAMSPKLAVMRREITKSLQSLLTAVEQGKIDAATAVTAANPEFTGAAWAKWAQAQHQALTAAPGRKLTIGNIVIRKSWAAAAVSDAQGRPDHRTVITLMQFPDGAWRPVRFRSQKTDGSERDLQGNIRTARMLMGAFRTAVLYKAGKLTETSANVTLGGGLGGHRRTIEITASQGTLRLHFQARHPQLESTLEVGPDRILSWTHQKQNLSIGRSGKWTGDDGLTLEAGDSKVVFTRDDRKAVLEAVGDRVRVRVRSGTEPLTASKLIFNLPTLEATASDGEPTTQAVGVKGVIETVLTVQLVDADGKPLERQGVAMVPISEGRSKWIEANPYWADKGGKVTVDSLAPAKYRFVINPQWPTPTFVEFTVPPEGLMTKATVQTRRSAAPRPDLDVKVSLRSKEGTSKPTLLDVTVSNNTDTLYTLSATDLVLCSVGHRVFPPASQAHKGEVVPPRGKGVLRLTLDWDEYCSKGLWCSRCGEVISWPGPTKDEKGVYYRVGVANCYSLGVALPQPSPATQPAAQLGDESAVREVAKQLVEAIRAKDIAAVKALAVGSVEGWLEQRGSTSRIHPWDGRSST